MIKLENLIRADARWREYAAQPEMNPLSEDGALQEAQLLDVRFDAVQSTAALLFDLRSALQLRQANTGLLIGRYVHSLSWSTNPPLAARTAWTVGGSTSRNDNRLFALRLGLWPNAQLELEAESAEFYAGDVPGLDQIPDYVDDDEYTVRVNLASWQSDFAPVHAVFLDRAAAS